MSRVLDFTNGITIDSSTRSSDSETQVTQ
ncbi:UNVERIFIED_CONTAM: hypothetical protein GTU68_020039 [Idotea baltica]|nr:hypothetical protein [Idotea baltica]